MGFSEPKQFDYLNFSEIVADFPEPGQDKPFDSKIYLSQKVTV